MKSIKVLILFFTVIFIGCFSNQAMAQETSGDFSGGSIMVGPDTTACAPAIEGAIRYDSASKEHAFCDGTDWLKLVTQTGSGDTPTPPAGNGYFVITSGTWDGDLGGMLGADAKCLSDLTANNWMGKGSATVDADHVFANICSNGNCNNAYPSATYFFAVSGDNTKGGASFTADSTGKAPGNNDTWSGTTYFDGTKEFWTHRGTWIVSLWTTDVYSSADSNTCDQWNTNLNTQTADYGITTSNGSNRWSAAVNATCDGLRYLTCFVNP